MIRGEDVVVLTPVEVGRDGYNHPIVELERDVVPNVLFHQSDTQENDEGARPDGTLDQLTLHFPKGFYGPLRGCYVEVRGRRYRILGDPRPYMDVNCPGPWHMQAKAVSADG